MTAEEFKQHRHRIGWTQKQTAEALGITVGQVAHMESGRSGISRMAANLFQLYRLGDWPGRPTGATTAAHTSQDKAQS